MTASTALLGNRNRFIATIATQDPLDVRSFTVSEGLSRLFDVRLHVVAREVDLELEEVLGQPASFSILSDDGVSIRAYRGVCISMTQTAAEESGLSSYDLVLAPALWLLTERRNYRIFQRESDPAIVLRLLDGWGIRPRVDLDVASFPVREYRVQYAESDFDFLCRLLEEAGVTFFFDTEGEQTELVLTGAPQAAPLQVCPLAHADAPAGRPHEPWASGVTPSGRTRPGRYVLADWDLRAPHALITSATAPTDTRLERFHWAPSALHSRRDAADARSDHYPVGDRHGAYRRSPNPGEREPLAQQRLDAKRSESRTIGFVTNALTAAPGAVIAITGHPNAELAAPLLVVARELQGDAVGEGFIACEARPASARYLPTLLTAKPRVQGIEPATVIGPRGEEIHVDELGRVKVRFHWDRDVTHDDDDAAAWIVVSHAWAGAGYGHIDHPRVGHEVLVDFLCGDPEQPIVVGRLYTAPNPVLYPLPQNATKSGWRSHSTPGGDGFNEIMFEDAAAQELVRFQAQKASTSLVKRDSGTVVRRDSDVHVDRDHTHTVYRDQTIRVGRDRRLRIQGTQRHFVDEHIYGASLEKNTVLRAKQSLVHHSNEADLFSVSPMRAIAGRSSEPASKSFIAITPDKIVIQSPLVDINPGAAKQPPPPKPTPLDPAAHRDWYFFGGPEEDASGRAPHPSPGAASPSRSHDEGGDA